MEPWKITLVWFLWHLVTTSIFMLFLFSSVISYFSKEISFKNYAIYSFLVLLYLILKMPYDISIANFILNSKFAGLNWYIQVLYHCAYFFFFLAYLNIKVFFEGFFKLIKKLVWTLFYLSTAVFLISISIGDQLLFKNYFLYFYTPIMFLLGLYTIYKALLLKGSLKYFFSIGSGIFISLAVVSLLMSLTFTNDDLFPPLFYFFIGLFIEHLIFAFGLAYKVRIIDLERAHQHNENERIKLNQKRMLQKELKIKEMEVLKLTKEAERQRTAKLKSKYESEAQQLHLVSLQSQMKPHFIFNALNSIKSYLIDNNKEEAIFYLNKFSKLIRKILESSRISEVCLLEELETIKLYVGIESMRFESNFKFEVLICEGVDINTIKVPPLILQPFIENAIWHGLLMSKKEKIININIYKDEQTVLLSLKDNGIGRKRSMHVERKTIKRKSLGLKMTDERINFYNQNKGTNYSYAIHDLYDGSGESVGTEVIFAYR